MSAQDYYLNPWDDTPIYPEQNDTFMDPWDVICQPVTSTTRKSSLLPILDTISEVDEQYEDTPYLNENSSNQETSYADNIYLPVLAEVEEDSEEEDYFFEADGEEDGEEEDYFFEANEFEQRAYPNGHPVDEAYNYFASTLTNREKADLDDWLHSISDEPHSTHNY